MGENASKVHWIVSDTTEFRPDRTYDFWHDRATFHFLTAKQESEKYLNIARQVVNDKGYVAIGTFSDHGPNKKYSEQTKIS